MGRPQIPRNAFLAEDTWLLQGLPFIRRFGIWPPQRVHASFGPNMGEHFSYIILNTETFTVARHLKTKNKRKALLAPPTNLCYPPHSEFLFFLNNMMVTCKNPNGHSSRVHSLLLSLGSLQLQTLIVSRPLGSLFCAAASPVVLTLTSLYLKMSYRIGKQDNHAVGDGNNKLVREV